MLSVIPWADDRETASAMDNKHQRCYPKPIEGSSLFLTWEPIEIEGRVAGECEKTEPGGPQEETTVMTFVVNGGLYVINPREFPQKTNTVTIV